MEEENDITEVSITKIKARAALELQTLVQAEKDAKIKVEQESDQVDKLNNFREIYDKELLRVDKGGLEWEILNLIQVRAFVYEVCKGCLNDNQKDSRDRSLTR